MSKPDEDDDDDTEQLLPELFTAGGYDPVTGTCWDGQEEEDTGEEE